MQIFLFSSADLASTVFCKTCSSVSGRLLLLLAFDKTIARKPGQGPSVATYSTPTIPISNPLPFIFPFSILLSTTKYCPQHLTLEIHHGWHSIPTLTPQTHANVNDIGTSPLDRSIPSLLSRSYKQPHPFHKSTTIPNLQAIPTGEHPSTPSPSLAPIALKC